MVRIAHLCSIILIGAAVSSAALAQTAPATPSETKPPSTQETAIVKNPNLAIATVKLEDGYRAGKVIGSRVYNANKEEVGTVDDLIISKKDKDKVVIAVISVGNGFLGIGNKLIAVPYDQLQFGADNKLLLPNASKQEITAMPSFTYGS
jgi:sporulation protein YlmC with PRC-barrel domain